MSALPSGPAGTADHAPGAACKDRGPSEPANTQFTARGGMKPKASLPGSRAGIQPPSGAGEALPLFKMRMFHLASLAAVVN